MDGSAAAFVSAIDEAGVITLPVPRRYIRILKPVRVAGDGGAFGELRPYSHAGLQLRASDTGRTAV